MYSIEESGAFVETFELEPTHSGPLDGLRWAAKDLIDVAGYKTGCGNPTWRETHPPAVTNAVCVDQLLSAGARCVGKTLTDELAFSLDGENYFYGTPVNPRAPDRVPGGSSSGSASAVACRQVDFALGTDTGGSIRIPANNCGIYGMRPSHDRVSLAGVMAFAPTYDTVGVLAADPSILDLTARVLLGCAEAREARVGTMYLISEAFEQADDAVRSALAEPVERLRRRYGDRIKELSLENLSESSAPDLFRTWFEAFRVVQWAEIWSSLGDWVERCRPEFGPRTRNNFSLVRGLDRSEVGAAVRQREFLFRRLHWILESGDVLCMPTAPAFAPVKGSLPNNRSEGSYYPRTVSFNSLSGVGRLPQVSMPLGESGGVPVGLSLLTRHGEDAFLLDVMAQVVQGAA
ncbi:MAG: amidase [Chloroflexota bacterium]|nr:MAG: amidase [Chloroflexota bacterium]